jgi:hypothetical protein
MRRLIKQGEFGENRPSPIPIIENPETGETEPAPISEQFSGTPVAINSRDTVRELSATINARTKKESAKLVKVWDEQRDRISGGDITRGGLSTDALDQIEADYQSYADESLSPLWLSVGAIGAANIVTGITGRWPQTPGTVPVPDLPGPSAQDWIRVRKLNLVVDITEAQRIAANNIIQRGLNQGLNERVVARHLKPVIGLTNREAKAVDNFRRALEAQTPKINARIIERRVATKARRLHTVRARRIARTEMTWAYNMGQLDAVKSYQAAGWIPANQIVAKKWRKVLPVPECFCDALDGQIVGIESTFPGMTPQVPNTLTPPAHPNCACAIDIVIFEGSALNIPGLAA